MRKVTRLDMISMLWLFGIFYALVGLFVASKAVLVDAESVLCPFGFAYPMCTFYLYLTVHLPHPATWLSAGIIVITVVFYSLTGLISGAAVVLAYNLVARIRPLLTVQVEGDTVTSETGSNIGLV